MYSLLSGRSRKPSLWIISLALLTFGFVFTSGLRAQGASNDLGNGGHHTIQGRLYLASGRRSEVSGLKIRLRSSSAGDIFVITDETGTFTFRSLNGGSYSVVIEGGGLFEDVTEYVFIDDPGSSSIRNTVRMRAAPRIVNVQIYLRPLAAAKTDLPPSVLNVKWADIPKQAIKHYDRGLRLVRETKDREAEAAFRRSIEISPSFAPAYTELGRIAQRTGNLKGSIDAWKNAIHYDPSNFDAHLSLGVAYLNLKKYDDSEAALVSAAFIDRSAVTPHYYLGIVFVMKNDLDIARKAFETAKELKGDKTLPALHKYLGRIYMKKSLDKEAIREFETYIKLLPTAQDAGEVRKDISDLKARQN